MSSLNELVQISNLYGADPAFVIAGGGNTSFKDATRLYVKASGTSLATITADGFAVLDRQKMASIMQKEYSRDALKREEQIKHDLAAAACFPEKGLRPSVEASLHDLIEYSFVVHTHPTLVNGLLCSVQAEKQVQKLFPDALFIPYTDPGYVLSKTVETELQKFKALHGRHPKVIFLQNHGVFVGADTIAEIQAIYAKLLKTISARSKPIPSAAPVVVDNRVTAILPALRMLLSEDGLKVLTVRTSPLIASFSTPEAFQAVALPFTPDAIVYCKARPLCCPVGTTDAVLKFLEKQLPAFKKKYQYLPKVICIPGLGLVGADDTAKSAETVLDVFEDSMKVACVSRNFGGPNPMSAAGMRFIDNWEVENYRRKVAKAGAGSNRASGKIIIVTGAAQGFGAGIAETLFAEGANVVIADLNEEKGRSAESGFNGSGRQNRAFFVKTDVSSPESVEELMAATVKRFGGLDVIISNAGILRAGGLQDIDIRTFDLMTKVNYTGYFLCAKYASAVMKQQRKYKAGYFMDIIQINSKSGLEGSKNNFTYAGGKFGGIGLTQSFALELIPFGIKVNAICPGNFFDGPLWSDPVNGLFVQYLRTGKVPGARTIEDVKKFYESKVPVGRGCAVSDVMKAVFYIMEQEYETGQAVPVTGGQVMLN